MKRGESESTKSSELVVLAVRSYNPVKDDIIGEVDIENTEPQLSEQLIVKKGHRYTVQGSVNWWLYAKSEESGTWGYIPSTYVVPLQKDLDPTEYVCFESLLLYQSFV